jgi:Flp pilus assembly protein TadG
MNRKKRKRLGVAAVEFGLLLPFLLAIVLGIIDYGYVFFIRLNITNAAREGARVGVTRENPAQASADAQAAATRYLQNMDIQATVTASQPTEADPAVVVGVTVDPFKPLIGFVPTPTRLSISSTMRWELAP